MAITRRTLLSRSLVVIALAGGAAAGLTRSVHHKVAVPPPAPPQALTGALAGQRSLLAGYDAVLAGAAAGQPRLTALRAQVAEHGDALRGALENYPGWRLAPQSTAPATATASSTAQLAAECRRLAGTLSTACLQWPATESSAGTVVPLLGSMSAALTTQAAVLA